MGASRHEPEFHQTAIRDGRMDGRTAGGAVGVGGPEGFRRQSTTSWLVFPHLMPFTLLRVATIMHFSMTDGLSD